MSRSYVDEQAENDLAIFLLKYPLATLSAHWSVSEMNMALFVATISYQHSSLLNTTACRLTPSHGSLCLLPTKFVMPELGLSSVLTFRPRKISVGLQVGLISMLGFSAHLD